MSGLNSSTARKIYDTIHSNSNNIKCRKDIINIRGIGEKIYTQCIGFLSIPQSIEPLDITRIHPSDYKLTMKLIESMNIKSPIEIFNDLEKYIPILDSIDIKKKCKELKCEYDNLEFIIKELKRPSILYLLLLYMYY